MVLLLGVRSNLLEISRDASKSLGTLGTPYRGTLRPGSFPIPHWQLSPGPARPGPLTTSLNPSGLAAPASHLVQAEVRGAALSPSPQEPWDPHGHAAPGPQLQRSPRPAFTSGGKLRN